MSRSRPPEIDIFNAFLEQVLKHSGDGRAAVALLSEQYCIVNAVNRSLSFVDLIRMVETIVVLIDEVSVGNKGARTGERLKERIYELFTPDMLSRQFSEYMNIQRQNIQAIIDMMPYLDHLEFDSEKFSSVREEIEEQIEKLQESVASNETLSDAQQRVILAQLELIRKSTVRFSVDGVGPFRDSIFTSIGRLTIELKMANEDQAAAVRSVIDDLMRVKEVAELAGGALRLTGPFIAGLLAAPVAG